MNILLLDILKLCFEIAELIGRIAFALFGVLVIYFISSEMIGKLIGRRRK